MAECALTPEYIDSLTQIWEGFSLMDKHGVAKENCLSLEDMKQRLKLHYLRQMGQGRTTEAAQEVITTIRKDDEHKRNELKTLFEEVQCSLRDFDPQVIQHLVNEGTLQTGMEADFRMHMQNLTTSECPILVAGETSSGKSSLLNLLLGKEILPQCLLSCTSVICKLRYGQALKAVVHRRDDSEPETMYLKPNENPVEQLSKYIFKEENREEGMPYKAVEIFLPLALLQTGVYIIDSPGFGEHPHMDQVLMDYIASNEIFAFIYVIKSDNAGGVQEDRLQKILRHIVEKQKNNTLSNFDPRAAIFVCNRWDLIPEKEQRAVKADTFRKLSRCWPELEESQLFYLSTTKAWSTKMVGYVSDDYSELLDGIQRLIPVGLQRKITHSFRWLEHFLARAHHHVAAYLAKTRLSAKELQARHKVMELRLHRVEKESEVIMKKLDKRLDKSIRNIAKNLSQFLKSSEAQEQISSWRLDELPAVHEDDLWMDVETDLDVIIEKRLSNVLRDWDEMNKLFQSIHNDLLNAFKEEFLVLESQLNSIEHLIQSDDISLSDKSDEEMTKYLSLTANIDTSEGLFDFNLNTLQKIALGIVAPVLVPVALGVLIGAPLFLLWDFKKWRRRSLSQKNLSQYMEDPSGFMQKRSMYILDKVADHDNVTEYVNKQMEPARTYLTNMQNAVPKLMESNRSLIESITHDKHTSEEIEEKYLAYDTLIPMLQDKLATFGNTYIKEYDFADKNLVYDPDTPGGLLRTNKSVGLWTELRPAQLHCDGEAHGVTVKVYRKHISPLHLFIEDNQMRKVRHPNLAKFHGTFEAERGIPGYLLEPNLIRARLELFGFRALPRQSRGRNVLMERCRKILEQIGMGLEYLHYRGLVHMELSLDTVMIVINQEQVKLTNIGEPRKADLPRCLTYEASDYVYLPPEVLRGGVYRTKSDMYSLGLMAWELWNQDRAMKTQRKVSLEQFIKTVRPTMMTEDDDNPFSTLIKASLMTRPEERICATNWVNEIRKIDLSEREDVSGDEAK